MIEFGKTLRDAREAKGMTASQVAEKTNMMSSMVTDLENENFTKIAAPIYGRGFVRLYCEAVGIDPKPMIAEYMDIVNGNREVQIKERVADPAPADPEPEKPHEVEPIPQPEFFNTPPPIANPIRERTLFDIPEPIPAPAPTKAPEPEPVIKQPVAEHKTDGARFSRYANPIDDSDSNFRLLSPTTLRLAIIAIVAGGVLLAAFIGLRALYSATSGKATQANDVKTEVAAPVKATPKSAATDKATAKPATQRKPENIAPLYID